MKNQYTTQVFQPEKHSTIKNYPNQEKCFERLIYSPSSKFHTPINQNDSIQLSIQNMKNRIQRYESPGKNRSINMPRSPEGSQRSLGIHERRNLQTMKQSHQPIKCDNVKGFLRNSSFNTVKDQELAHTMGTGNQPNNYFNNLANPPQNQSLTNHKNSQNLQRPCSPTLKNLRNAVQSKNNHDLKTNHGELPKNSTKVLIDKLVNRLDCSFEWLRSKQNQKNAVEINNMQKILGKNSNGKFNHVCSVKHILNGSKIDHNQSTYEQKNQNHPRNPNNPIIRGFQFGKKLGKGKFGEVYLCRHLKTGFLVAIKRMSKQKLIQYKMVDQFTHEIKLHSSFDNPHIVKFYGYFEEGKHVYLIMEYMNGGTLFQYLSRMKKIPLKEAVQVLTDVIDAVSYLHQKSIVHRDIKPENIVLSSEGVAKLCDFGWSAVVEKSRKTYCGTFDYAAPQVLQKKTYGIEIDIWCIGVLAYEILTGKVLFQKEDRRHRVDKIIHVDENHIQFPNDIAPQAQQFISALVQKDPANRPKCQDLLKFRLFQSQSPTYRFKRQN